MAKIRISDLASTSSLSPTDFLPSVGVSSDTTYKITVQDLANSLTEVTSSISASYSITASYAEYSSQAYSASYALSSSTAESSSYSLSSSYSTTASYAANGGVTKILAGTSINVSPVDGLGQVTVSYGGGGGAFPFTGSAVISGSLEVTGSVSALQGGFTGSLFGSSSYAITASYALNVGAVDASKISTGSVTASVNVGDQDVFQIVSASSALVYLSTAGNLGVGPTNPTAKLHLSASSGPSLQIETNNSNEIYFTGNTNANIYQSVSNADLYYSSNGGALHFGSSTSATHLNIVGGKVGIATNAPTQTLEVNGNTAITGSLVVSGSNGAGVFSQGATLVDYISGIASTGSYMVWRAPFSCSVVALYGYYVGGTAPEINAVRSGSSGYGKITGSNVIVNQESTWVAATASLLQNVNFNAGDSLQIIMSGSTNYQLAVQVDFIRKF